MQGQCPESVQPQVSHGPSVATPPGLAWCKACCWVCRQPYSFGRVGTAVGLSHGVMSRPGSFLCLILPPSRFSHLFDDTARLMVASPYTSMLCSAWHGTVCPPFLPWLHPLRGFTPPQVSPLPRFHPLPCSTLLQICSLSIFPHVSPPPRFYPHPGFTPTQVLPSPMFQSLPGFTVSQISLPPIFQPSPCFTLSQVSPPPRLYPSSDSPPIQVPHHPRLLPGQVVFHLRLGLRSEFHDGQDFTRPGKRDPRLPCSPAPSRAQICPRLRTHPASGNSYSYFLGER